jgi:uncharacterized protein DUF4167
VAEKYLQLARDAHTGNNPIAAENYLQHAEHYFRLIAAAEAVQLQAQKGDVRATENPVRKTWTMITISVACPIASPLRGSKRGRPSPTKPTSLRRPLSNGTDNDSPWFGVRSRRRSAVTMAARIDIGDDL